MATNPFKPKKSTSIIQSDEDVESSLPKAPVTPPPMTIELANGRSRINELPDPISDSKRQDMEKVRQHQLKLNKYGANLEVDGIWGKKTEAASRELYPKYKPQTQSTTKTSGTSVNKTPAATAYFKSREQTQLPSKGDKPFVEQKAIPRSAKQRQVDAISRDEDLRREARIAEKMVGDSDLHIPALNREQAAKSVDLEDEEDSQPSQLGQIGKGLGIGALALGSAALVGAAVKGKLRNNKAILAAAKAGRKLPLKQGVFRALGNELSETSVVKGVKSAISKVASPFREASAVNKVIAKSEEKAATQAANKLNAPARKAAEEAEKQARVFKKQNASTPKNNETMLNRTQGEQDAKVQRALRANKVAIEQRKANLPKSIIENREKTRSVFRTDKRLKSKNSIPTNLNDSNYKSLGYRKLITGGTYKYVKK